MHQAFEMTTIARFLLTAIALESSPLVSPTEYIFGQRLLVSDIHRKIKALDTRLMSRRYRSRQLKVVTVYLQSDEVRGRSAYGAFTHPTTLDSSRNNLAL